MESKRYGLLYFYSIDLFSDGCPGTGLYSLALETHTAQPDVERTITKKGALSGQQKWCLYHYRVSSFRTGKVEYGTDCLRQRSSNGNRRLPARGPGHKKKFIGQSQVVDMQLIELLLFTALDEFCYHLLQFNCLHGLHHHLKNAVFVTVQQYPPRFSGGPAIWAIFHNFHDCFLNPDG